jgi:hypothetical protein
VATPTAAPSTVASPPMPVPPSPSIAITPTPSASPPRNVEAAWRSIPNPESCRAAGAPGCRPPKTLPSFDPYGGRTEPMTAAEVKKRLESRGEPLALPPGLPAKPPGW